MDLNYSNIMLPRNFFGISVVGVVDVAADADDAAFGASVDVASVLVDYASVCVYVC